MLWTTCAQPIGAKLRNRLEASKIKGFGGGGLG